MDRRIERQRWSLAATVGVVTVGLAVAVALLIGASDEFLPDVPGLDYRVVQGGLVVLALAFTVYVVDRERQLRRAERRIERERQEAERLRDMDEMKNAFLRSISHDLRTPLTVIVGMAETLEGRGEHMPAETLRDAAQRIGNQARRLDSMLTDLLDLERIARGMVTLHARDIDLSEIVRRTVDAIGTARAVAVPSDPVRLRGDETLVERIVDNLVRNALKYTSTGTPVWVHAARTSDGAELTVEDAGPGIPDDSKAKIFNLFSRGETAAGTAGTGVGLSLVRQFAELHGGRAWVEDRPGGGARFRVLLGDAERDQAT